MMKKAWQFLSTLTIISAASTGVAAQDSTASLMAMDIDSLRSEIQNRYDAALAQTMDPQIVQANDTRYFWSSEAKVQCAIALGYLKSSTRDETSIGKCDYAYNRMRVRTEPPVIIEQAPRQDEVCDSVEPGIVFFDWDSDVPGADARQTVDVVAKNARDCGWNRFRVVGHADRSGSDAYNDALSARRAQAIASIMQGLGIPAGSMTVSSEGESNPRVDTPDGVREQENRRVEITVSQ